MAESPSLTASFRQRAEQELEILASKIREARERVEHFQTLMAQADAELREHRRLARDIEELLDIAPQLSIANVDEELRGQRVREVAVDVLRQQLGSEVTIHYSEWYDLVVAAGYTIAAKDPLATFLTHISRSTDVERVGRRTGTYRLRAAA